jgi:fucose permease
MANNLLGLAAGPFVAGLLADRLGLAGAMKVVPLMSVLVIVALLVGRRAYPSSVRRAQSARPA